MSKKYKLFCYQATDVFFLIINYIRRIFPLFMTLKFINIGFQRTFELAEGLFCTTYKSFVLYLVMFEALQQKLRVVCFIFNILNFVLKFKYYMNNNTLYCSSLLEIW